MRAADLPVQYNAVQILEHNLATRSDKTALYSREREYTFRQIAAEVNQVGNALRRLDVRPGESVGILCLDTPEWVTAFFGAVKIGAVAVSFNTLLKAHEHAFVLRDARVRTLIVHESLLTAIEPFRDELEYLRDVIVVGQSGSRPTDCSYREWIASESTKLEATRTHRDDICTLNYSSGTTGEPKGIPHAHKDLPLTAQLWGVNVLGLRESDRTFAAAKLFFTYATGGNLIFPWYVGASVILMAAPPRVATNVLDSIQRFRPTLHFNAPTGYAALMASPEFAHYDLSSLRLCVSAGESLPAPIWQAWKERTGLDIIDGIGSTENYHIFLSNRPGDVRPGSSGRPFDGYELRIVDDKGHDLPQGEVGNLWVRGETASLAYHHNAERSRRTFLGPWLVTGDKYYVDADGYYWHAGRSDDMLKVGGIWVSPTEVESTLLKHPAVLECAVVGQTDQADLIKPKAYVVLKHGHSAHQDLAAELVQYCREQMADYKRPRWIDFVSELPKNANGKIQRFKLRATPVATSLGAQADEFKPS